MGDLANRVSLDKAMFQLTPVAFERYVDHTQETDPDIANIEKVYSYCHKWVFNHEPSTKLPKQKGILLSLIREADVSVKLYFLTNMLAWQNTHHTLPFKPGSMIGPYAVQQVKTWAKACHDRFGVFNTTSLDLMASTRIADQDFVVRLRNSEVIAGSWIVGYKLNCSGDLPRKLYEQKELELDPYWLAIEETYIDLILHPWVNHTIPHDSVDIEVRKHRFNAVKIHAQLKRENRRALLMFKSREKIMLDAIQRVLAMRNFTFNDFKITGRPVTTPLKFWAWLGVAIQQIELRSHLLNLDSVYV